jgi:probable HAF family extracellular repeat protein
MCYNRDSRALEKACGEDSAEGGATMKRTTQNRFKALTSACVLSMMATVAWSQSITWLGTLPGGGYSEARGVSANGAVVVGFAVNAAGLPRAFRWTASGGMQDLGTLPGFNMSYADAVSADGSVVVGTAVYVVYDEYDYFYFSRAFRWTAAGGMQGLGTLPGGGRSAASGVSADGAVVVGTAFYYDPFLDDY